MCTVSFVMDHYKDNMPSWPPKPSITIQPFTLTTIDPSLEAWKKDIEGRLAEMERHIKAAKEIDTLTGQPDCELDSKRLALKKVADELGVKIRFLD